MNGLKFTKLDAREKLHARTVHTSFPYKINVWATGYSANCFTLQLHSDHYSCLFVCLFFHSFLVRLIFFAMEIIETV